MGEKLTVSTSGVDFLIIFVRLLVYFWKFWRMNWMVTCSADRGCWNKRIERRSFFFCCNLQSIFFSAYWNICLDDLLCVDEWTNELTNGWEKSNAVEIMTMLGYSKINGAVIINVLYYSLDKVPSYICLVNIYILQRIDFHIVIIAVCRFLNDRSIIYVNCCEDDLNLQFFNLYHLYRHGKANIWLW